MNKTQLRRDRLEKRKKGGQGQPCVNCGLETERFYWEGTPIRLNPKTQGFYKQWFVCRNEECPTTTQSNPEDYRLY